MNVAVTLVAALTVAVQVREVPLQGLLHPVKTEPGAGAAVKTIAPAGRFALQVAPQLIPLGNDWITPEPVPAGVTLTVTAPASVATRDSNKITHP
jgi:hypothetical protein